MLQSIWIYIKRALIRLGIWLVSFVVADLCFSLYLGLHSTRISASIVFLMWTAAFAAPAWLLFLPVVVGFKDAEGWRFWTILCGGILVGPVSLFGSGVAEEGLFFSIQTRPASFMELAVIVGFLTTGVYVCGIKILHRRADREKSL